MSTTTLTNMEPQTIAKLQDLLRVNMDSAEGFRAAADAVNNERLRVLFRNMAEQRRLFADELAAYISGNGKVPEYQGSFKAKLHRWWLDLKGKFTGGDEHAVLVEAERGEDAIKAMYEEVLPEIAGNPINDILVDQYGQVKEGHDHVRNLRDSFKND